MAKVLFVAAHPDDETLGCGGTILRHKAAGDFISWLIISNIDTSNGWKQEVVETRQQEIETVAGMYGFNKMFKLDFPTTRLDTLPMCDVIKSVSQVLNDITPEIIYVPNRSDVHTDHQITFQAVYSCTKNFRLPSVKRMLMYETLSETDFLAPFQEAAFVPNVFVDVSSYFAKKLEIMQQYPSELMKSPLPRSLTTLDALGRYRGSRIGVQYAEAFMLIEEIV